MSKRRKGTVEHLRELPRQLGLAHAGGAGEQERADRLVGSAQSGARPLDRAHQRGDGLVLPVDDLLQLAVQALELAAVRARGRCDRDARHLGDQVLDVARRHRLALVAPGPQAHRGAHLVHHVDGLVGQPAVVQVLGRELDRGPQAGLTKRTPWCSS